MARPKKEKNELVEKFKKQVDRKLTNLFENYPNKPPQAKLRSQDKFFTERENVLLDQITIEITEAWKKDLKNMKDLHLLAESFSEKMNNCFESIDSHMKDLQMKSEHLNYLIKCHESKPKWWQFWR